MKRLLKKTNLIALVMFAAMPCLLLTGNACEDRSGQELRIAASTSLSEVLEPLRAAFLQNHSDYRLTFDVAGTHILLNQIRCGTGIDLCMFADKAMVERLADDELISSQVTFASNHLALIVPEGNPRRLAQFEDLRRVERIVIGTEDVPVGYLTQRLLESLSYEGHDLWALIRDRVVSREQNVRLVRAKVELGEADAAVVYRTDGMGDDAVTLVQTSEALQPPVLYEAAVLKGSNEEHGSIWLRWLESEQAQSILRAHGFAPVP